MTFWTAAASFLILAAAGGVPTYVIVGRRWLVVPLAPLSGAVVATIAGILTLAIGGAIVPWFVSVAVVAALGALGIHVRLTRRCPTAHSAAKPIGDGIAGGIGAVLLLAAVTWSLLPLRVPSVGWDARAIWMLRASWFAGGHTFLLNSFRDPIELLAHSSYPPLISTSVAVCWQITGNHSNRLGVVVVGLLNACAAVSLGWVLVESGLEAGRRAQSNPLRTLSRVVGVFVGPIVVLTAFRRGRPFRDEWVCRPAVGIRRDGRRWVWVAPPHFNAAGGHGFDPHRRRRPDQTGGHRSRHDAGAAYRLSFAPSFASGT